jgi:hypothetical protein
MVSGFFASSRSKTMPEVPWVMGDPRASYEWQVSVARKGKRKDKTRPQKSKKLENIVLKIQIKTKKKTVKGNVFTRLLGGKIEEDFNPIIVAEALLRALHHAKFKRIIKLSVDGEVIYDSSSGKRAFKDIINLLDDEEFEGTLFEMVRISAEHKGNCIAKSEIKKVHLRKQPSITISFKGKIDQDNLNRFLGYIRKHMSIENIRY